MPTHKKAHDKDKYYHLAKDQGYRSRAAFKLIQINRRFDFLSKSKVLIDLCAAPGGWCQVAAKHMPAGSIILGVDLLPIRAIRNVKTIVGDITTSECRKMIVSELQGWKADVVLCDGAPNIGSAYSKDAYVQNELVIAALKAATSHLVAGGTFCTKVYRSTDYNAIIWVLQQLFEDVQTIKPNSSRSQSSEIFLVCLRYTAPDHVDPKLLDPNHVFKEVVDPNEKKIDIFHKKYEVANKRHRTGYDESLGMTLRSTTTVTDFINTPEPIKMLSDVNEISFSPECESMKTHPKTTKEIIECLQDLKVLGKSDFKKILKWRLVIREWLKPKEEAGEVSGEASEEVAAERSENRVQTEEMILEEMEKLQEQIAHEKRKEKKKSRKQLAKERERQYLGMTNGSFDPTGQDMELFALDESVTVSQMNQMNDVQLEDMDEEMGSDDGNSDNEGEMIKKDVGPIFVEDEDIEAELEEDYHRYISRRSKKISKDDLEDATRTAKRKRKSEEPDQVLNSQQQEDEDLLFDSDNVKRGNKKTREQQQQKVRDDMEAYIDLLSNGNKKRKSEKKEKDEDYVNNSDSDSDDDDVEDDVLGEDDVPEEEEEDYRVVSREIVSSAKKAEKWFSNPIFTHTSLTSDAMEKDENSENEDKEVERVIDEEEIFDDVEDDEEEGNTFEMPKTEKQKRKEKRAKEQLRRQNKLERQQRKMQENQDDAGEHETKNEMNQLLLNSLKNQDKGNDFEIVPADHQNSHSKEIQDQLDSVLPVKDSRKYDSDNEDYDQHDRVRTLALGTMMLRRSKKKSLVDASYNRFAWNDPVALPDWFVDDEMRHNKPQLPIPQALMDQIKSKFQLTGGKEIKKVAEARARKRKRAADKLKSAKKQATVLAENPELSEKQKLKAISRAMKGKHVDKPGKVYVVATKTKAGSVGTTQSKNKGKLKFVDSRMKCDTRALKRKEKMKKKNKRKK